jgi:hypothetical protein
MTAETASDDFSHPVKADSVGTEPVSVVLTAGESQRVALARRFGLQRIDRLAARVRYRRVLARDGSGPVIRVEIDLDANVSQLSVVSLEPIQARIEERRLTTEYALESEPESGAAVVDIAPDGIDPPEPLTNGRFDLGALVAEYFALSLDPYPREAAGAYPAPADSDDKDDGPFAVLRAWRDKDDGENG